VPELEALQRALGAALADSAEALGAAQLFVGDGAAVLQRLGVYRGNMVGACGKALSGTYPVVAKIVGEPFFEGLAREYLRRHPSVSGDLNEFGASFAEFVSAFPHTRDLPYLPDVARMEWLAHRAYYAADAAPLDLARLAGLAEDDAPALRFALAPSCALLESRWPLARLWEVHQDGYAGEPSVDFEAGSGRILVHRRGFRVAVHALSPGAYRFLERAREGRPLGELLDAALAEEPGFDLGAALREWVAAGIIVDIEKGERQ
jgi:uncharacterized protein